MHQHIIFIFVFLFYLPLGAQCEEITLESITNPGPYNVGILEEGIDLIRNGPDYDGATIYYPENGTPPYAGIAIIPGYCGVESDIQEWGPFYASHGVVAITLGTNDPCADWPSARALALLDAIVTVKEENIRENSPLQGKVDVNSFAVSGWSMGGGGSQLAASIDPSLKAVIGLCPWLDLNGFQPSDLIHDVPVLIFTGQSDDIANSSEYGYMHYQGTPSETEKLYFEILNGGHGAANSPVLAGGEIGIYALSWLKTYLLNEPCYCEFLLDTPSNSSSFETNVECLNIGIEENKDVLRFIGPNPVDDYFELLNDSGEELGYTLCGSDGKLLKDGVLTMGYNKINFRFLKSQSYFLFSGGKSFKLINK